MERIGFLDRAFYLNESQQRPMHIGALLELAPERADDVRRFQREGRLEFANAFLLSGALGVTGGEALMRMGIEGVQWTDEVFGVRPRTLWLVDSTGIPNQMPQIAEQLGVSTQDLRRERLQLDVTSVWPQQPRLAIILEAGVE